MTTVYLANRFGGDKCNTPSPNCNGEIHQKRTPIPTSPCTRHFKAGR